MTVHAPPLKIKRVYEPPAPGDGMRILVDGLWPRGLSRARAGVDLWLKDVAPSAELRRWFDHDPAKWAAFRERYAAELDARPEAVRRLVELASGSPVTLLFAARDAQHSNAMALKGYLERHLTMPPESGR